MSRLRFPRVDDFGFDVEVCSRSVLPSWGATCWSRDMRIREIRSRGKPFRWFVESRNGPAWQVEAETGLLVFNYLGKRSERVYQNRQLPGRTHRAG